MYVPSPKQFQIPTPDSLFVKWYQWLSSVYDSGWFKEIVLKNNAICEIKSEK